MKTFLAVLLMTGPGALSGQQLFIEVSRVSFNIDRDFDDSRVLTTGSQVINVPALSSTEGIGIEFGSMYDNGAWSIAHVRADPFAPSVLGDTTARVRSLGLETMLFPYAKSWGPVVFNPSIRIGMGFTAITIPGSAQEGTEIGDATYRSLGINAGAGLVLRLRGYLHILADFTRRIVEFNAVNALDQRVEIDGALNATADFLKVGLAVYIP